MQLKIPAYVIKYDSSLIKLKKIKALWAFNYYRWQLTQYNGSKESGDRRQEEHHQSNLAATCHGEENALHHVVIKHLKRLETFFVVSKKCPMDFELMPE